MVYYHGTVKKYLKDILKNGLQPCLVNAWRAHIDLPWVNAEIRDKEEPGYVYLTSDLIFALNMAHGKAEYLRAKPGETMKHFFMTKDKNTPIIHTTPVVLKVDLPSHFNITPDPHSGEESGYRYHGVIDPKYISVEEQ
jgi:hypothetical protein